MNIDVKALMLKLLATQKGYVLEDPESYFCAMVAVFTSENESYIQFPKFEDEDGKIAAYNGIVAEAKEKGATLIITVNHARQLHSAHLENFQREGLDKFDESNSDICILLTASGPGLQSCSLELGYSVIDGRVEFGEEEWLTRIELGLLPDWPGQINCLTN